jgi:protein TonB
MTVNLMPNPNAGYNQASPSQAGPERLATLFTNSGFGTGVRDNLKELFEPAPRGPVNSRLITEWNTGFGSAWQNLRTVVSALKLTPAETSGEPVPEIWSRNTQFTRVQALSIALHAAVLALVIGPLLHGFVAPSVTNGNSPMIAIDLSSYKLARQAANLNGGGGGAHDKSPAYRGRAPKMATVQYAAPVSHPIQNPKFSMPPTLLGNVTPPNINRPNWGNPLASMLGNSLGTGDGTGIGGGHGSGLGNGDSYGVGEDGPRAGTRGYGNPACLYCPNAQFSDEAVKAKHQGVVLVTALITRDGRATNVHVVKGLGLGLDENALAAVKTWRFRPATGPDGRPAAVEQTIEVNFRLI